MGTYANATSCRWVLTLGGVAGSVCTRTISHVSSTVTTWRVPPRSTAFYRFREEDRVSRTLVKTMNTCVCGAQHTRSFLFVSTGAPQLRYRFTEQTQGGHKMATVTAHVGQTIHAEKNVLRGNCQNRSLPELLPAIWQAAACAGTLQRLTSEV